jgi:cyclophilin family peptidyl-prolyl cis-trans isomerase/HEAT repeat protein
LKAYRAERNEEVRHRILEALSKTPSLRAPKAILGLPVPRRDEAYRALAFSRLGSEHGILTENVLVWLLDHLTDPDPMVRLNAAYFVGYVHTAAYWMNRDSLVRGALASYRKDDPAAIFLLDGIGRNQNPRDAKVLEDWGATATDWRIRATAFGRLGAWDPHEGVTEALLEGLDDPSALVGASAAAALLRRPPMGDEVVKVKGWIDAHPDDLQIVAPLLTLLARDDDSDFVFRWLAAVPPGDEMRMGIGMSALGQLGDPAAFDTLKSAMTSSGDPERAADAAVALAHRWRAIGPEKAGTKGYLRLLSSALRMGSAKVTSAVTSVLADPQFLKLGSADTLVAEYERMSAPADVEPMLDILSAIALSRDTTKALPLLRQALTAPHPALRQEAAADLTQVSGRTVTATLGPPPAPAHAAVPDPERIDWTYLAQLGAAPRLVLETNRGTIEVQLDTDEAPQTVQTVARLAESGKYDGSPFHRVVPNFVVQGGDFTHRDGSGGPGFTIESELTEIPFLTGVIGMARASQKDTEGSQFFITHSRQPQLDGSFTAFGWVVKGMDVVDRLVQGDTLVHASISRGS